MTELFLICQLLFFYELRVGVEILLKCCWLMLHVWQELRFAFVFVVFVVLLSIC